MAQVLDNTETETVHFTEWSPQLRAALHAPTPSSAIKVKNQGGNSIRYTTDKYVQNRLDTLVGEDGWEDNYSEVMYTQPIERRSKSGDILAIYYGTMNCTLTILGRSKGATCDIAFTPNMYGSPSTNAQAQVFKRAAMKFGVARELWDKDEYVDDAAPMDTQQSSGRATQSTSAGSVKAPSDSQITTFTNFGIKAAAAKKLNAAGGRESEASKVLSLLIAARKTDQQGFDRSPVDFIKMFYTNNKGKPALEGITPEYARRAVALFEDDDDDFDQD